MSEKRKYKRASLVSYLDVHDTMTNKDIGYVVDISQSGMLLISKNSIPVDISMILDIKVPEEITETKAFNVTVKSIRSIKDGDLDYFNTAFVFNELKSDDLLVLDNIIAAFEF